MISITVDSIKNIVTASSFAPLIIGFLIILFVANKIAKLLVLVVAVVLGLVIFSQRSTIDECATRFTASENPTEEVCRIFGHDFRIDFKNPISTGA